MYKTIPGFEDMTAQQVFDMSASHLLKQMKRSLACQDDTNVCAYRGSNGLKCAAGVFLTDDGAVECDAYGNAGNSSGWEELVLAGLVPDKRCYLISRLQKIHDYKHPSDWRECLVRLAEDYNLDPSVCNQ